MGTLERLILKRKYKMVRDETGGWRNEESVGAEI